MTARGAAPPAVEDGIEPNPPPQWRPGDADPRTAAPPPPPAPPPAAPAEERTADGPARAPAPGRSDAARRPDAESGPAGMATFLDRLVRGPGREAVRPRSPDDDAADDAAAPPAPPDAAGQPGGPPAQAGGTPSGDAPPPLTGRAAALEARLRKLSPGELDALSRGDTAFARVVQGEIDRRAFTAQRQLADQGQLSRQQQLEHLTLQEQQLRQTDVYEAARVRDQIDAMRSQDGFLTHMVKAYDAVSLDPLLLALPEAERKPILEAMPPGMDGRKYVTEQAIARIKANAQADAERRLRRSPAFRKQVLAELRGEPVAEDDFGDEPELGADRRSAPRPRNNGKSNMDAFIRRGFGQAV